MLAILTRNLLLVLFILVSVPLFGTVAILLALFEKRKVLAHKIAWLWCRLVLFLSGVKLEVEGLEKVPPGRYVFLANHQSQMDIPVLEEVLKPYEIRFLAKKSLFKIPFFGWGLTALGYIPVEREDPREGLRSLLSCVERIKAGYSVVVFPEGTRSPDGRLLPFKTAGFILPIKARVAAVPVAIIGTRDVLPKGSLWVRPGRVKVKIGPPIPAKDLTKKDKEQLASQVRIFIGEALSQEP